MQHKSKHDSMQYWRNFEPTNDAASTWWLDPTASRPNGVTTTGGRPPKPHLTHLTSNPFPHLIPPFHFSFIVFPIACSTELFQWTSDYVFNIYCPFAAAPPPAPATHFTSVKCLKVSERNWSVSKWSTHIILISSSHPSPHLISPVDRGSSPPSANQQQQQGTLSDQVCLQLWLSTLVNKQIVSYLTTNFC